MEGNTLATAIVDFDLGTASRGVIDQWVPAIPTPGTREDLARFTCAGLAARLTSVVAHAQAACTQLSPTTMPAARASIQGVTDGAEWLPRLITKRRRPDSHQRALEHRRVDRTAAVWPECDHPLGADRMQPARQLMASLTIE